MNISNLIGIGYNLLNTVNVITISAEFILDQFEPNTVSDSNLVILVLDKSGSMTGAPFKKAKESILKLIKSLYKSHQFMLITYAGYEKTITQYYDHNIKGQNYRSINGKEDVQFYDYREKDISFIEKSIQGITVGGTTSFKVAFDCIRNNLTLVKNKPNGHIIFFTDGEDTDTEKKSEAIAKALDLLVDKINTTLTNPQIHCLGFGQDHDAKFLGDLTTKLAIDGTFQYIETVNDMENKISNLIPLLDKSVLCGRLINNSTSQTYNFTMIEKNNNEKSCTIFINDNPFNGTSYTIELDTEDKFMQNIDIVETDFIPGENMSDAVNFIGKLIADKTAYMINNDLTEVDYAEISSIFEDFYIKLEAIENKINNISAITTRNNTNQQYLLIKSNIKQFITFINKVVVGSTENDDIAKMFDIAYSGNIKKSSLSQEIMAEDNENIELFASLHQELEERAEIDKGNIDVHNVVNKNVLNELKYLNVPRGGTEPTYLMSQGDCLCVCVKVSRTLEALDNPSHLKVTDVYPLTMSACEFQEKYKFALDNADIDKDDNEDTIFNKKNQMIIYGKNKEEINAVLPLCIFEEHWVYAKRWLRLLSGLNFTTNQLKYSHKQYNSFPFLVFGKILDMIHNDPSRVNTVLFSLVEDTCHKIYKSSYTIQNDIEGVFDEYIKNTMSVTSDGISNNTLLISYLYFSRINHKFPKNITQTQKGMFVTKMIEEEARRTQINNKNSKIGVDFMFKLFNLDKNFWINKHVKQYEKDKYSAKIEKLTNSNYKKQIYKELKEGGILIEMSDDENDSEYNKLTDELVSINLNSDESSDSSDYNNSLDSNSVTKLDGSNPEEWNGSVHKMSNVGEDMWTYTKHMYDTYAKGNLSGLYKLFHEEMPFDLSLEHIGIETNEQKLTFSLQNYIHNKDEDRTESVVNNTYRNPFKLYESKKFLVEIFTKLVNEEKKKRFEEVDNKYSYLLSDSRAEVFAMTDDLYVAAGALKGTFVGSNISSFVKKLQTKNCTHAIEKIEMLFNGSYVAKKYNHELNSTDVCTIILYADSDRANVEKWKPSKQNCFRLWKQNQSLLEASEWVGLFDKVNKRCNVQAWCYYWGTDPIYRTKYAAYKKYYTRSNRKNNHTSSMSMRQGFSKNYNEWDEHESYGGYGGYDSYGGYDNYNTGYDDVNTNKYKTNYPSDTNGHCSYIS